MSIASIPGATLTAATGLRTAAAAPPDGQSAVQAPADAATVSNVAPVSPPPPAPVNPWPELERLGLVGAAAATGGAIGQALSQSARQGLLDAVTRLQSNGVTFERQRSWFRVPFTRKHVPLTPAETLEHLERQGTMRLGFNGPGESHRTLRSLDDVRGVDALYGLGPDAVSAERDALRAFGDLQAMGWKATAYYYSEASPYLVWQQLHDRGQVSLGGPKGDSTNIADPADLVALGFLVSGNDHGVKDRPAAQAVRELGQLGVAFGVDRYRGLAPLDAYRALSAGNGVRVGFEGSSTGIVMRPTDIANPASVKTRLDDACSLYARYLRPVLGDDRGHRTGTIDFCVSPGQRFTPELRAAVCHAVLQAWSVTDPNEETLIATVRQIEGLATDEMQLAWLANHYAAAVRQSGFKGGQQMLAQLGDGLRAHAVSRADVEHLRPILFKLLEATHSMTAAVEGLDLVRVSVARETEEQRVQLFLDIAAYESETTLADTAAHYRAVLVHRRPDEDLVAAGATFVNVLKTLTLKRQQERAVEVFAAIEDGLRRGAFGSRTSDQVMAEFGQAVVLGRSVDDALSGLQGGSRGAGVPAGPSEVERRDDSVIIGGIRVPRSQETPASPG